MDNLDAANERIAASYDAWRYLGPVLDRIHTRFKPGMRILELGCGAGLHAALLSAWGYEVTAVDNDERIVKLAAETAQAFGSRFEAVLADATQLPDEWSTQFDLVFSLGLMEHFDRDVTVRLLREQARVARHVMVVVPSRYTRYVGIGITDERIYTIHGWRSIFRDAGLTIDDSLVFTEPPTKLARMARLALPAAIYKTLQRELTYGMSISLFGSS
ncbi:MAG TPA: class I SAM-dependent methyltransferase [Planosporangium sp.]|nr:class I SAM-dependent methyltransferase [Planosporangium sp.]